jgi:hypothetical protein
LTDPQKQRIHELLQEGWTLLEAGRGREAVDVFGRVLLPEPQHAEARRGFEQARRVAAEEHRGLDARMDEALAAVAAGDAARAHTLLEEVVARGGDRDRARALLDRLATQGGRIEASRRSEPERAREPRPGPRATALPWRRVFVTAWLVVFALVSAALVLGWDRLLAELTRAPIPSRTEAATR